ncbi:hypothetical protein F6O75_01880 [Streptococcus suis]|nr:hypothetical protein [Streptococcus suis]MBL1138814.1 hypothetical protein [Streptococcus suis]MBL1156900.1 hypothetical protein [Streptococcus suis]MBL1158512.1 hypothetical protein [Streptococcus suis]MBL1182243.1 hypothetical protein [Streptococcus suis]
MECETRTNLAINHCAEMLTRTLRREAGQKSQPLFIMLSKVLVLLLVLQHFPRIHHKFRRFGR